MIQQIIAQLSASGTGLGAIAAMAVWLFAVYRVLRNERRRAMLVTLLAIAVVFVLLDVILALVYFAPRGSVGRDVFYTLIAFVVGMQIFAGLALASVVKRKPR